MKMRSHCNWCSNTDVELLFLLQCDGKLGVVASCSVCKQACSGIIEMDRFQEYPPKPRKEWGERNIR